MRHKAVYNIYMALASSTKGTVTEPSLIAFSQYITYLRENKERKSLSPKINALRYTPYE